MSFREEVKPSSDAPKFVLLLLLLAVLAGLIIYRSLQATGGEPIVVAETTQEVELPTNEPTVLPAATEPPTPTILPEPVINLPTIDNAIISPSEEGDQLNLSGTADTACEQVVAEIDGLEVGRTVPTLEGVWTLSVPAPAVGLYDAVIVCETENDRFAAEARRIEVPENAVATTAAAEVVAEPTPAEPTPEPTPVPVAQPEFTLANKMDDWIGGPLLVRGTAESNSEVELLFDNGTQPITTTATANEEGRYAARVVLTEPGEYAITAQYAGTEAEPSESVVVPADITFGNVGNCVGTTPPFGTIEGDVYIVNSCEYFSLIANRLGVSYRDLLNVNRNIANPNNIRAGDRIQIPPLP